MKPEFPICLRCKIMDTCHPELYPVIVGRTGTVNPVKDKHKHVIPTWCGNYTCGMDGEISAQLALANLEAYEEVAVTEYSGEINEIWAVPFGSSEKRTDLHKHRVITPDGQVYAKQDDMYYATQKIRGVNSA